VTDRVTHTHRPGFSHTLHTFHFKFATGTTGSGTNPVGTGTNPVGTTSARSVNLQPTGFSCFPTGLPSAPHLTVRKLITDRVFLLPDRFLLRTLFVNFTPDRVSVLTDRYSYLGTVTRVCNYFYGRIHLHCWHHQLLPCTGHILLMVEFPELALFRILTCIHFSPGRVLPTPFSTPRPVFFTSRPGA